MRAADIDPTLTAQLLATAIEERIRPNRDRAGGWVRQMQIERAVWLQIAQLARASADECGRCIASKPDYDWPERTLESGAHHRPAGCDGRVWLYLLADYVRWERPHLTGCYRRAARYAATLGERIPSLSTMRRAVRKCGGRT